MRSHHEHDCTRPPRCQDVVDLYGQGLPMREVAQQLGGVSLMAVYKRLVRHGIARRNQGGRQRVLDDLRERRTRPTGEGARDA